MPVRTFDVIREDEIVVRQPLGVFWVEARTPKGELVRRCPKHRPWYEMEEDPAYESSFPPELQIKNIDFCKLSDVEISKISNARTRYFLDNEFLFPRDVSKEVAFLKRKGLVKVKKLKDFQKYFSGKWQEIIEAAFSSISFWSDTDHFFDTRIAREDLVYAVTHTPKLEEEKERKYYCLLDEEDQKKPLWVIKKNLYRALDALISKGVVVEKDGIVELNVVHVPSNDIANSRCWVWG